MFEILTLAETTTSTVAQSPGENSFFIQLLEKGGLPALTIGIIFTIFMFWMKAQARQAVEAAKVQAAKDVVIQQERESAREREHQQQMELMKAYEEIVREFIVLSKDSTRAVTRLSERVGQCPLRTDLGIPLVGGDKDEQ